MAFKIPTDRFLLLDGGMGTLLQKAGLKPGAPPESMSLLAPDVVTAIHRDYIAAGAEVILTNTFGSAARPDKGFDMDSAVKASIACGRAAAEGRGAFVALDMGPTGELLEPGGLLSFEAAYERYAHLVRLGARGGADLIIIETMADLLEAKAALLAAREHSDLPVLLSMTFEGDGRSFGGVPVEALGVALGAMGPDALGINCSVGPAGIFPLIRRLSAVTGLPLFIKPNAGLPDPITGAHNLSAMGFAAEMAELKEIPGLIMAGGCCGTTPEHISKLKGMLGSAVPLPPDPQKRSRVCSATRVLELGGVNVIGERINPTGKPLLKESLKAGDFSVVQSLAAEQEREGAAILDINVGLPGADERELLPRAVKAVQAVSGLPIQIDSADPAAIEAALRVVSGRALVNSTTGEKDKLAAILPLCKKYGAMIVGLTLDEGGIPDTAEGRIDIARNILSAAEQHGLSADDVAIDCLTLAASALPGSAEITLSALKTLRQELGVSTVLGVSNISFGLPARELINRSFLTLALGAGLTLPILNPGDSGMTSAIDAYRLLSGEDTDARDFIARHGGEKAALPQSSGKLQLKEAVLRGLKADAANSAKLLLATEQPMAVVEGHLMPALDIIGREFEAGRAFLPQLLSAAQAAQAAFEQVRMALQKEGKAPDGPPVVVATVQGDVHDIGKNIVRVLLSNYGFRVIDLGRDVPPEAVCEAVENSGAGLVGLSALMTTTLPAMARTVELLRERHPDCRVMVGGAVLTEDYARFIGAHFYGADAGRAAAYARDLLL